MGRGGGYAAFDWGLGREKARETHPTMKATPPKGVTAPSHLVLV